MIQGSKNQRVARAQTTKVSVMLSVWHDETNQVSFADEEEEEGASPPSGSGVVVGLVVLLVFGVLGLLAAQHLGIVDWTQYTSYIMDWIASLDGTTTIY